MITRCYHFMEFLSYNIAGELWHGGLNNVTENNEEALFDNPAELGIVTGLLTAACICNFRIAVLKEDFFKEHIHLDNSKLKSMLQFLLNIVFFFVISPLIFVGLFILHVYRTLIILSLKIQLRDKFAGLLEGADCIWAVEKPTSKSVINILGFLDVDSRSRMSDLLFKLRGIAQRKLVEQADEKFGKLSHLRKKKYGYFYWEKCDSVEIEERVRWLETFDDKEELDEESLNRIMSEAYTKPMPQEDQASWEILLCRNRMRRNSDRVKNMEEGLILPRNTRSVDVPIIFRVHHTVGDGFALFKLLMSTIADSSDVEVTLDQDQCEGTIPPGSSSGGIRTNDLRGIRHPGLSAELMFRNNRNILGASMPFGLIISFNLKESIEKYLASRLRKFVSFRQIGDIVVKFFRAKIMETADTVVSELRRIFRTIFIFIEMPSCLVQQSLRSMDNSALHGPKLTGRKIISWWIESESDKNIDNINLLTKIQRIKNATGTKFGDVVLAALSASLHNYYQKIGEFSPKSVTVVLPARMPISEGNSLLNNGFSVGLLSLPIRRGAEARQSTISTRSKRDLTMVERLFEVARSSYQLRSDSDYKINFLLMNWLSAALPEILLRPILESYSTLIFSNIPGPREVKIAGHRLGNLVFWVPHRGTTGIGFSLLSYGGKIHLGIGADEAVIRKEKLLVGILENTVKEIDNLHEIIFMSHFSKSLNNPKAASMDTESESCAEENIQP